MALTRRLVASKIEFTGKWERINDVDCYVATPPSDYDKAKVLIFCCDAFGAQFVNNQLLADAFAQNGFKVSCQHYSQKLTLFDPPSY
jgi:hypothetical protein